MRILALPASVLLAFCIYPLLPHAPERIQDALRALYTRLSRKEHAGDKKASAAYLLLVCACPTLISALHPLLAALTMAPLFSAASVLPGCSRLKNELDSGAYAQNIPEYERKVRSACRSLASPFVRELTAPLLLCSLGTALHLGSAPGWLYAALLAVDFPRTRRTAARVTRISERIFCALLSLCAGAVGRSPFRFSGDNAETCLLRTLGVAGDESDTHAPVSGDITQGVFLCCFCCALLCFALCLALLPLI